MLDRLFKLNTKYYTVVPIFSNIIFKWSLKSYSRKAIYWENKVKWSLKRATAQDTFKADQLPFPGFSHLSSICVWGSFDYAWMDNFIFKGSEGWKLLHWRKKFFCLLLFRAWLICILMASFGQSYISQVCTIELNTQMNHVT